MDTTPSQSTHRSGFDLAERQRIRAALLRYMEAHRIGAPTLQARIAQAADRSIDLIPLKTLQRFLGGATRTNDAFLVPCQKFALSLPDYSSPAQAAPAKLASMLGAFLQLPKETLEAQAARPLPGTWLAGSYQTYAPRHEGIDDPRKPLSDVKVTFTIPYGTARFDAVDTGSFVAEEEVFNPRHRYPFNPHEAKERHRYDGFVFDLAPLTFALMRNRTTRLPKLYWLTKTDSAVLRGTCIETLFILDRVVDMPVTVRSSELVFAREEETLAS